jgi:uroporphyrinogen-III synthase
MSSAVALTLRSGANQRMASALADAGIHALDWPATALEPVVEGAQSLEAQLRACRALVFVSPGVVDVLVRGWPDWSEWVSKASIASMGPGTTEALVRMGLEVSIQADPPRAAGMIPALLSGIDADTPIMVLCGDRARPELVDGIRAQGRLVEPRIIYRSRGPERLTYAERPLRAVVYGSPSGAERMLTANPWLLDVPAVALGPTTGSWLREHAGHSSVLESEEPDSQSVIAVLQQL